MRRIILSITIFLSLLLSALFIFPVFASTTDGTIDPTDKYAWGENVGWINFGADNGNVHVTDSALSGSALGENIGWINLDNVVNDGAGNLSGYGWGENVGWINFDPTNGGVIINSSGEFTGSALGENIGWIIFSGDDKVKTDWRPRSARPACNNASDDDGDGKTDYPADPGCSSLDDSDETDPASGGGGLPLGSGNSPVLPEGGFSVMINQGARAISTRFVNLQLKAGSDTVKMAISNFADFRSSSQETFSVSKAWTLEDGDGSKTVYVKFFTQYGQSSSVVSASVNLDTTAPTIRLDALKDYYNSDEDVILSGQTEADAQVILRWNQKYGLARADALGDLTLNLGRLSAGDYVLEMTPTDAAGNKGFSSSANLKVKGAIPESSITPVSPLASIKNVVEQAPQTIKNITDKLLGTEEQETVKPPELIIIPQETPVAFLQMQDLLPKYQIDQIALAPLPKEITDLVGKFPQLIKTLADVGVTKFSDIDKLKSVALFLPGLTENVGLASSTFESGYFTMAKGIPIADLSAGVKQKMPTDMVFAKTAGELVDFNIALSVNAQNMPEQRISTIVGKPLQLSVKPDRPVKSVTGYIVFKARNKTEELGSADSLIGDVGVKIGDLATSLLFGSPVFAETSSGDIKMEEKLVLAEFEYIDPDGDGIYTAEVTAPAVEGEYEVITVLDFVDPSLGKKVMRLITVVDPEGFVYTQLPEGKMRIAGATAALYWMNPATKQYEVWPAKEYQQENPQITDDTGKYSFLVPPGLYYLEVDHPKYPSYQSDVFTVKEGVGIHMNVELKSKNWWVKYIDWKMIVLFIFGALLFYNFYRDRGRDGRRR